MASNSSSAVLGLLVLLQIAGLLALALGSLYLLYCLGRAAAGLDRLASVAEAWLVWQQQSAAAAASRPAPGARVEMASDEVMPARASAERASDEAARRDDSPFHTASDSQL